MSDDCPFCADAPPFSPVTLSNEEVGMLRVLMHRRVSQTLYSLECMEHRKSPRKDIVEVCAALRLEIGLLQRLDFWPKTLCPSIAELTAMATGFWERWEAHA